MTKPTPLATVALTATVVAAALLGACTEENTSMSGPRTSRSVLPSGQGGEEVYPEERPFWNLAQSFPSTAGFFIDTVTGNVVVSLTNFNEAKGADVRSRLGWVLSKVRARNPHAEVLIRQVRYTFLQLKQWRDQMNQALLTPGVDWLDLDEVKNRLVFGIDPGADSRPIRALARNLGVPLEALEFEVDGPLVRDALLTDSIRPIEGATQIEYDSAGHIFECTLGFTVLRNGQRSFVTDSHCSSQTLAVDSTRQYQPRVPTTHADSLNILPIGVEVADYSQTCPPKVNGTACSYADAAIYKFTGDSSQWVLGRIARPTYGCFPGPCNPTNLQIDPNSPYFTVTGTDTNIVVGDLVSMIGIGTGWSQAYVQHTCVNISMKGTGLVLLCQEEANYGRGEGDSGAPILLNINPPPDSTVTLGGIHQGHTPQYSVFGPWSGVARDYPGLSAH